MILYASAETNIKAVPVAIELALVSGKHVLLTWDSSDIDWDDGGFAARYKGVYVSEQEDGMYSGEEYYNGHGPELEGAVVSSVVLQEDDECHGGIIPRFRFTGLEVKDGAFTCEVGTHAFGCMEGNHVA